MTGTAAHDKQVEDLMAPKVLMLQIKEWELECVDNTADRIDDAARKKPHESCH